MTLVSVWNQLANLAYPIVALFLLTMVGEETAVLATAAFVGVAILGIAVGALVLVLYSNRMAVEIGDLAARGATWVKGRFNREPVAWGGSNFERFRVDVVDILKRRWHLLTLATLAGSLTVFVVLLVSLRALGVSSAEVSVIEAFAAWALARLLGSIPITPGGIGVVELSLTAALIGFGGNNAGVVAAVLVFRFLTIVPTLVLGMVAAAVWRRISKSAPATWLSGRRRVDHASGGASSERWRSRGRPTCRWPAVSGRRRFRTGSSSRSYPSSRCSSPCSSSSCPRARSKTLFPGSWGSRLCPTSSPRAWTPQSKMQGRRRPPRVPSHLPR